MDLHLFLITPDAELGAVAASAANPLPIRFATASSLSQAEPLLPLRESPPPLVLLFDLGRSEYLRLRQWAQKQAPHARLFFLSSESAPARADSFGGRGLSAGLLESGEWILRPAGAGEWTALFARLLGDLAAFSGLDGAAGFEDLVGRSIGFRTAVEKAMEAATTDEAVLLTGESGSGKAAFARALHAESGRPRERFFEVDCRALPEGALERLLPSGSCERLPGSSEAVAPRGHAEEGTFYLKDISALDRPLQAQLARWLATRKLAGTQASSPSDHPGPGLPGRTGSARQRRGVRLIAGTRYDLALASRTGAFDRELYRCLAEREIKIPPLRERPSDVLLLAEHLLRRLSGDGDVPVPQLTAAAKEKLVAHSWPGNVRELIGVLQMALIKAQGSRNLDDEHLSLGSRPLRGGPAERGDSPVAGASPADGPARLAEAEPGAAVRFRDGAVLIELPEEGISFDEVEKAILLAALTRARGNVVRAARLLRLGRGSLRYRLEKHAIMHPRRRRVSRRKGAPGGQETAGSEEKLFRAS